MRRPLLVDKGAIWGAVLDTKPSNLPRQLGLGDRQLRKTAIGDETVIGL